METALEQERFNKNTNRGSAQLTSKAVKDPNHSRVDVCPCELVQAAGHLQRSELLSAANLLVRQTDCQAAHTVHFASDFGFFVRVNVARMQQRASSVLDAFCCA
jgi:hypothetical protein